jgi:hypothetical protein
VNVFLENKNWTKDNGEHDGGVSMGIGFTIAWQRGPINEAGRNGAFVMEVLDAVRSQLEYFQNSKYQCDENQAALDLLSQAMQVLQARRDRRAVEGTLGTTKI